MSGYNIEYYIKDFAQRTQFNLNYIKLSHAENGPYEVTQLVNSLFGLIVLPVEEYKGRPMKPANGKKDEFESAKNQIKEIMETCEKDHRYRCTYGDRDKPKGFIKHLRNAVSHSGNEGIHFIPLTEAGENITGIIFYDRMKDERTDKHLEFCVDLHISELESIVENATRLYSTLDIRSGEKECYKIAVEEMRKFLKEGKRDDFVSEIIKNRCDEKLRG